MERKGQGHRFNNLIGKRTGSLVVIKDERGQGNNPRVTVRCDCLVEFEVIKHHFRSGRVRGCGQCAATRPYHGNFLHGLTGSRVYHIWLRHRNEGLLSPEWLDPADMVEALGSTDCRVVRRDYDRPLGPDNHIRYDGMMGSRRMVVIDGTPGTLTYWAEVLGISREWARRLANRGELVPRVISQWGDD